jgi:hypothetical protein
MCAFSHSANAVTVTYSQNDANYTALTIPTSSINPTPAHSDLTSTTIKGEVPGLYRSPFENSPSGPGALLSDGGRGVGDWSSLQYTSIQGGGSATYDFSSPMDNLSILWGSPDSYNTISFYSGDNGTGFLYSITGSALDIQTYGHDLVDFAMLGGDFESVILSSKYNAFEFADLQASNDPAAPLPSTLPLLASGLGAVFLLTCRKNRRKTSVATN